MNTTTSGPWCGPLMHIIAAKAVMIWLKHLDSRLKVLKVAAPPENPTKVSFGCWVTYEEETGEERCYQLVGSDEIDVSQGMISIDSPIGQALLNKKVDDEVTISKPSGRVTAYITGIYATRP